MTINSGEPIRIVLQSVESAVLNINAPRAHVSLNLKSIQGDSQIHCSSAEITVSENNDKCIIYDQKSGTPFNECPEKAPVLRVLADEKLDIQSMSDFDILRKQIMSKMESRKKRQ